MLPWTSLAWLHVLENSPDNDRQMLMPGILEQLVTPFLGVGAVAYAVLAAHVARQTDRQTNRMVFFSLLLILTTIFGCLMYVIEGPANGFGTIPKSIYWAIVTITTVGYGDVVPHTPVGQFLASIGMLTGYAIIAVPTGILTAELALEINREKTRKNCRNCERAGHDTDARFCKYCGARF